MSHRQICRYNHELGKAEWHDADEVVTDKQLMRRPLDWESNGLGCHPDQVGEWNQAMRDAGISSSAYHRPDGTLVVSGRDRGVRNQVIKFRGDGILHDLDGGYGDY